jgi:Leucine-rich repeat (LRR) protein
LNDNNICRIHSGAFESVPSLNSLALNNNRLTRIYEEAFGKETQHKLARLEVAGTYKTKSGKKVSGISKYIYIFLNPRKDFKIRA